MAKNAVCMWLCSDMCCCLYLLMCVNFRFAEQHLVPVPVPDKRWCGTKGNEIGLGWQLAKHTHFTQTDALLPNEWAWQNCLMTRRKRIGNWMDGWWHCVHLSYSHNAFLVEPSLPTLLVGLAWQATQQGKGQIVKGEKNSHCTVFQVRRDLVRISLMSQQTQITSHPYK